MSGDHVPYLVEGDLDDIRSEPFDSLQLRFGSIIGYDG